jgi:hypothetical protein
MAYDLGRDVAVYITTESDEAQVDAGSNVVSTTGAGAPADVAATATITFAGSIAYNTSITIISTDGTSREYVAKADNDYANLEFDVDNGFDDKGLALKGAIEHASGHNGKITVSGAFVSGEYILTLTQAVAGTAGNKPITEDMGNTTATSFTGGYDEPDYVAGTTFADNLDDDPGPTKVPNLTGVDIGISATDEDITYMGKKCVLKAEIKRETTVSLTRKKSDTLWDTVFLGPTATNKGWTGSAQETGNYGARWGVIEAAADDWKIFNGLAAPSNVTDVDGTDVTFGYRVHIVLKDAAGVVSVPGCTITGHTVSLNADGTTEETLEFISNVTPKTGTTLNYDRLTATDM